MRRPCPACAADRWGICERHERMAEDIKDEREHGDGDSTGWRQGLDSYERYLDRMWE